MEKMAWDGPQMGPGGFFPPNPDPADILGRTDLDFENCCFFRFVWIPKIHTKIYIWAQGPEVCRAQGPGP